MIIPWLFVILSLQPKLTCMCYLLFQGFSLFWFKVHLQKLMERCVRGKFSIDSDDLCTVVSTVLEEELYNKYYKQK